LITAASRTAELDELLAKLEAQYEDHTERLTLLIARQARRKGSIYHLAEITAARRALAETARLLQRMAERDFGRCGLCSRDLPLDLLHGRPDARFCPSCEEAVPA
jgi:RNA polymerase-binding transcription factor DksA